MEEALGASAPFSLEPILVELEEENYIGPILPASLVDPIAGRRPAGGSAPKGGSRGGGGGGGSNKPFFHGGGQRGIRIS